MNITKLLFFSVSFLFSQAQSDSTLVDESNPISIISKGKLSYPKEAKEQKIEGLVVVQLTVDSAGMASDFKIQKGHPQLQSAALTFVRTFRFKNNSSFKIKYAVPVWFKLE